MSDQNEKSAEGRKAGFYLQESELEAMTTRQGEENQQQQTSGHQSETSRPSLARRRGHQPLTIATRQLDQVRRTHRQRSHSVPTLESLNYSQSVAKLLKQFADDYNEARSPVLRMPERRRSSMDFSAVSQLSNWQGLGVFVGNVVDKIYRRMSGADLEPPPQPLAEQPDE